MKGTEPREEIMSANKERMFRKGVFIMINESIRKNILLDNGHRIDIRVGIRGRYALGFKT